MILNRFNTSFRDSMSGLYSEAYFTEVFQREWHRMLREQDALSVIILRPHLNVLNKDDQLSFKLISELVENSTKRATDLVCRFQDNEIAVGLFNLDEDGTETIVHRVLSNMDNKLTGLVGDLNVAIGGLNVLPSMQMNIEEVFELTEDLATKAEQKGKNAYEIQYYQMH